MSMQNDDPFASDSDQQPSENNKENNSANTEQPAEQSVQDDNKLQEANSKIQKLELENTQLQDQLTRVKAEAMNIKKRADKDVSDAHKYAISSVLKDLLNVLDSFTQALAHEAKSDETKAVLEGMQLTSDMFLSALQKHGVEIINPKAGDTFDPNNHEAMSMQKDEEHESGVVLLVIQPGYALHGRVIRAARVIVNQ